MSYFMTNDSSDCSKVHVPWILGIEKSTLENSGWKFDVVSFQTVKGIHKTNIAMLEPMLWINLVPQSIVIVKSPESDDVQSVLQITCKFSFINLPGTSNH